MNPSKSILAPVVFGLLICAGCSERATQPVASSADNPATSAPPAAVTPGTPPTDRWIGQWDGPEGTSLVIGGRDGAYDLVISNLDGPRRFQARAEGERIVFTRDGVDESLRATNGLDTGMKWLSEKTQCLTVRAGEGYCRD